MLNRFCSHRVFPVILESAGIKKKIWEEFPFLPKSWNVRMIGLEPTRREALPPESSVSTNFTTCASEKWGKDNQYF